MSKPTGAICKLDCEYCFFLSEDHLYPGNFCRRTLDLYLADRDAHQGRNEPCTCGSGLKWEAVPRFRYDGSVTHVPATRVVPAVQRSGTCLTRCPIR